MAKKEYFQGIHLLDKSLNYAFENCIPLITTIELTHNCNFKCSHCYNFDRTNYVPTSQTKETLNKVEVLKLIDDISELGGLFINFSGGEATIDKNLFEYISYTRSLHMEARLKTNAALITPEKAQSLSQAGLSGVDVSIYAGTKETYKEFTGVDSYERVLTGLQSLISEKIDTHVSIILHRRNVDELELMINLCDSLNLPYQISTEVTDRYDESSGARENEITVEQYKTLLEGPYQQFFKYKNPDNSLQCSCARSVCGISASGEVYPCIGAPIPSGNIRDKDLIYIWKQSPVLNKIRNVKKEDFKECSSCDYIQYCNRSSGSVYINTGNYTGCEEQTLALAKLRQDLDK